MDNHYHLLIETPNGNLARGMRQLNGVYTQRFNRLHVHAEYSGGGCDTGLHSLADKQLRNKVIRDAYLEYGYTMIMIARQIGIHHSTVSKIIKGVR